MRRTGLSFRSVELLVLLVVGGMAGQAGAVPSYARQTGQECIACHVPAGGDGASIRDQYTE